MFNRSKKFLLLLRLGLPASFYTKPHDSRRAAPEAVTHPSANAPVVLDFFPPAKLKSVHRAFMFGLTLGYRRAAARQRRQVDEAVDRLESTNAEVRSLCPEFQRLKAIETGTNALRDPVEHPWLD